MGGIYRRLGFSVGCIQQGMPRRIVARLCLRHYLRDGQRNRFRLPAGSTALHVDEQVHRPFEAALLDEADSILIDEARIPLVIAGGEADEESMASARPRGQTVSKRLALCC